MKGNESLFSYVYLNKFLSGDAPSASRATGSASHEAGELMPVAMLGFQFRPDGFFERNPAMDVPPPAKPACCH